MLKLTINGEIRSVSESLTLAELIEQLGYDRHRIAVEVNREVVPLPHHGQHLLGFMNRFEYLDGIRARKIDCRLRHQNVPSSH